jgi:hypothetical protein
MARVKVRYGATRSDADKRLRGRIRKMLRRRGFTKTGAAEWEAGDVPSETLTQTLRDVADELDREPAESHRHVSATIDDDQP